MSVGFTIAGCNFRVHGGEVVDGAVVRRFAAFTGDAPADVEITVESRRFDPSFEILEPLTMKSEGGRAIFEGVGEYDWSERRGLISEGGIGEVDAMVRLALSLRLPERGTLLLHGAALRSGVALCGASGSGKSTAAAALGGACDELIAISPSSLELMATPWWGGRPSRTPLSRLWFLRRGGARRQALSGAGALRELLSHAVRYLATPDSDRALFTTAAELIGRFPVEILDCPEGGAFLPFLRGQL